MFNKCLVLLSLGLLFLNSSFSPKSDKKILSKKEKLILALKKGDCTFEDIKLYGKVKFVDAFEDIKIRYVDAFPDIKVEFVEAFPDKCGKWQEVEAFEDFKIRVVDAFEDLKVEKVTAFPGMQ
ncbi:hypothetical protein [Aureivirga sp. CE67]|uniref:hypothetical protein n=1 Tax=Aureivirga sp. CE67 TaxID=1788983 RepID=UPI0018CBD6BA|nr:hypothetical protein [Aureivirga sp. CE67]